MDATEKLYWLGFSAFPGIGPHRFRLLLEYFKSAQSAWNVSSLELRSIGLAEKLTQSFVEFRKSFSPEKYFESLIKKNISPVASCEKEYPSLLKEIAGPPIILYVRGDLNLLKKIPNPVAVVGTRRITSYGRAVTEQITRGLCESGCTIVSGLAYGVDTVAHKTAIEGNGKTIAVLGCGVDIIHPVSNHSLYWQIVKEYGVVISEFPPGKYAEKGMFPSRNRIISGLSLGVVVTEGAQDSGALITARYAAEQGREVFAVPGPITSSLSKGPMMLLKNGAKLTTDAQDILEELHFDSVGNVWENC